MQYNIAKSQLPRKKQTIFWNMQTLDMVQKNATSDRNYSIAEFEALMETIRKETDLNDNQIAIKAGYKDKNYLSQVKSKKNVSALLMDRLQTKFASELQKAKSRGEKSNDASLDGQGSHIPTDYKDEIISLQRQIIALQNQGRGISLSDLSEMKQDLLARIQDLVLKFENRLLVHEQNQSLPAGGKTPSVVRRSYSKGSSVQHADKSGKVKS